VGDGRGWEEKSRCPPGGRGSPPHQLFKKLWPYQLGKLFPELEGKEEKEKAKGSISEGALLKRVFVYLCEGTPKEGGGNQKV